MILSPRSYVLCCSIQGCSFRMSASVGFGGLVAACVGARGDTTVGKKHVDWNLMGDFWVH